jgi:hypothetical protein
MLGSSYICYVLSKGKKMLQKWQTGGTEVVQLSVLKKKKNKNLNYFLHSLKFPNAIECCGTYFH